MEYLRPEFIEYLNSSGEIEIEGNSYSRDHILREVDPEFYEQVFLDWLDSRTSERISKAKEILNLYDNRDRFAILKERYHNESVMPFVGAGMSLPSDYPGWTKFLYKLREETRIDKLTLDKLISEGKYEEAAQILSSGYPHGSFQEKIEITFGKRNNIYGPIQKLPKMFPNSSVVTTNFDDILERCFDDQSTPFEKTLAGIEAIELPNYLGENKRMLVKLHGTAERSHGRILTLDEYTAHYKNGTTLESVIEAISTKSLLFIGCSLTVDRTVQALASIAARKGHERCPKHYAFVSLGENDDRLARRDQLVAANIYPIWYAANNDHSDCIDALLTLLEQP